MAFPACLGTMADSKACWPCSIQLSRATLCDHVTADPQNLCCPVQVALLGLCVHRLMMWLRDPAEGGRHEGSLPPQQGPLILSEFT